MTTPSDVIDREVAAYNRRDIQGSVACYAPAAKVMQPDGSTLASGGVTSGSVCCGCSCFDSGHYRFCSLTSRESRRASPMKLKATTVSTIAMPAG
jgi:hypothetical protein